MTKNRSIIGNKLQKKGNAYMGAIEKKYGKNFGVKNDENLRNYLKEIGYPALSELLKNA